jgi:hypothetical protein
MINLKKIHMEDKIPTAREFLIKKFNYHGAGRNLFSYDELIIFATEFAKLHVKAALELASMTSESSDKNRLEIKNAYPLDNIK